MNIIKLRYVWYILSAILVGGSIVCLATFGLKQGIDFVGGSELTVKFDGARPNSVDIEKAISSESTGSLTIQPVGDNEATIRTKTLEEAQHQEMVKTLNDKFGKVTEMQYNAIGPAVGEELRQKSLTGLVIIFLAILAFIAYQFRGVSKPVESWKYGLVVIATAFHDVAVPVGLFAILGKTMNLEIGTSFIAAILTIMGYSINDTIVVMDRIRENLMKTSGTFEEIVERSLKQTMLRSFNTSMTTTLALTAVYIFGGESIKYFALALIVGILTGTYSSIFIASPLLVTWSRWDAKMRAKK